jgi:hypothetical protein
MRVSSRRSCCVNDGPWAWDLLAFFLGVVVILSEVVYMDVVVSSGRGDLPGRGDFTWCFVFCCFIAYKV